MYFGIFRTWRIKTRIHVLKFEYTANTFYQASPLVYITQVYIRSFNRKKLTKYSQGSVRKQVYVRHKFANKELAFVVRIRISKENPPPTDYHLFPALKQNPGCQKFKDRKMDRVVTWWLITEDMHFYQQRTEKFICLRTWKIPQLWRRLYRKVVSQQYN